MKTYKDVGFLKTALVFAAVVAGLVLYALLINFIAKMLDRVWSQKSLTEINRMVNVFLVVGVILAIAAETLLMLYPAPLSVNKPLMAPVFGLLVFLASGYFIVDGIKDIRMERGIGAFEEEIGLIKDRGLDYGHYTFRDREELRAYRDEIRRDAPQVRRALKHRDFPMLLSLMDKYMQKDLIVEAVGLEKEIRRLDVEGRYAGKIQELVGRNHGGQPLRTDSGRALDHKAQEVIDALEQRYIEDPSAGNTLALANAYRKFDIKEVALMYYAELLNNFKRSHEARMARDAVAELRKQIQEGAQNT